MNTSKIQTKKILRQVSGYFFNTNILTKPETPMCKGYECSLNFIPVVI